MQDDTHVLVWVGCNDPGTRDLITTAVQNQLQHYEENCESLKIVSSPLRSGSLMEVIDDYKPGFFDKFVKNVQDEATNLSDEKLLEMAGMPDAADYANRIVLANDLIVNGALTDAPEQKQYYLDQALQTLNADAYPRLIDKVRRQQIDDGVIDSEDERDWEWDKGMAP